ncbi:MAG: FlgO family outer membrane protein [Candidatus Sericytochromatia bacterium]
MSVKKFLLALGLLSPLLPVFAPPAVLAPALAQTASVASSGRLVVLPFRNLSRQSEDDWLGESFSENLTAALSQSEQLELVERSQLDMVMAEQGLGQSAFADEATAPRLGRLIGARQLLLGSFQKQGQRLLVNARLVDVETGRILSGRAVQLEGDYERLFALQSQLAAQMLVQLGNTPSAPALSQLEQSLKICASTAAYEKYQRGLLLARMHSDPRLREAISLFEGAIAKEPDFTLAHVALSEALSLRAAQPLHYPSHRADDLPRALEYAEVALKQRNHPEAVYRALARAYAARQQPEQALAAIGESLRQQPGNTDSVLVWLDLQGQQPTDLAQLQQDLVRFRANPEDPWIQFSLALVYLMHFKQHGETDLEAPRQLLLKVRRQLPHDALIPIKLAWLETMRGRYDAAYGLIQEALAQEPENYMILYKAGLLLSPAPAYQAQAEAWLKKSLTLLPDFAHAEAQLGALYYLQNRQEEARRYLMQARQHQPESSLVPTYLGLLAERQQQPAQAYTYLLQAFANTGRIPNEPVERGKLCLHLARLAQQLQRLPEAEAHARAALNQGDVSPSEVYQQLIGLPLAQGDYPKALQLFQEFQQRPGVQLSAADQRLYQRIYLLQQLQSRLKDPALLNDLGSLALLDGQLAEAESYLGQAIQGAPAQSAILFNLGLLRLQQQRYAEAVTAFRQVLAQDPTHRKAAFNLGRATLAQGDKAGARRIWEDLLRKFPGDADALQALEELER